MLEVVIRIFADGLMIPVILIGAWALLFRVPKGHRLEVYARIVMAGLTAYLFAKLIGSVFQPEFERPFQQLGVAAGAAYLDNPGFPSDHILLATALTLAVAFEVRDKKLTILLASLTALIALGRVFALVHTPLDIIGGALIACLGLPWYLQRNAHISSGTRIFYKKRVK